MAISQLLGEVLSVEMVIEASGDSCVEADAGNCSRSLYNLTVWSSGFWETYEDTAHPVGMENRSLDI